VVERVERSVVMEASSPDSARAAWTRLAISMMWASVSTVVLTALASTPDYYWIVNIKPTGTKVFASLLRAEYGVEDYLVFIFALAIEHLY
jgi:hypothetical protein